MILNKNDHPIRFAMLFAEPNTQTTGAAGLSAEMKTWYDKNLLRMAGPALVHDQFAQKRDIPKNGGKTIEFRQFSALPKALTAISEGVTPDGHSLTVTGKTATVAQYGDYVTLSDVLQLTTVDPVLSETTELLAAQAGRTLDTITREVLAGGTNVQYGDGSVERRSALVGGADSGNHYLTVNAVKVAVTTLKRQNAPKINGSYVAIIHPDVAFDLMSDSEWKFPHQYQDAENLYAGEIGMIAGARFVESTEAKIFHADDLASDGRSLSVNHAGGYTGAITTLAFDGGTVAADALIGRTILLNGVTARVTDNTASTLTFAATDFGNVTDNMVIYPGEAGAEGRDVYATLLLGANAYGVTNVTGGGLEMIVKPLGAGDDPLNQRGTVGWKAVKVAERLVEGYMVRVETASTFQTGAN